MNVKKNESVVFEAQTKFFAERISSLYSSLQISPSARSLRFFALSPACIMSAVRLCFSGEQEADRNDGRRDQQHGGWKELSHVLIPFENMDDFCRQRGDP